MKNVYFPLFVCVVILSACGAPSSVSTMEGMTSTPEPVSSLTFTPLPASTSSFIPTATAEPAEFSPVLYGGKLFDTTSFLLLGGVSADVWLAPETSVTRFSGEATYALHNMEYADKYFLWGRAPELSPTCKTYFVGIDAGLEEAGFVATLDGWKVAKRDVTELSVDNPIYQQSVEDWLVEEGVANPVVEDLRILRVDIEGDGVDEVFLSAHHFADESGHMTEAGDYSIILMRKVAGSDVATLGIVNDVYRSSEPEMTFPVTYSLANFIDLNQDGNLEVVGEMDRWEGFGAAIYQINGREVIETLKAFCAS
ncbi:MAG: hypothetical protein FIB03_10915 [Anaerolineae bacterium]|nr:hypothetical protein [Anaerolineae bacterium]